MVAAAGVIGPAWLLVVDFCGHGFKDFWQHRRHFVANTRWWPFCLVVDWIAAILVVLLTVGVDSTTSTAFPVEARATTGTHRPDGRTHQ